MADEFDPLTAPAVMPRDVRRIDQGGFPTTATLDWEQAFKGWTVDQTVKLNTKITTVRDESAAGIAEVNERITTVADDQAVIAQHLLEVETQVDGNTANISQLFTSVNGLGVQWAIQAYVGGSYGGVVFTGLKRADGTGADFLLEIQSNVVINGNLLVTGSVLNVGLNNNAATQIATASGDSSASLAINYRGTGKISIIAYYAGTPAIDRSGVPNLAVSMDGGQIDAVGNNYYAYVPSSGPVAIRLLQTTLLTEITPSPGNHTFTVTNGVGGGVRIWVFEGSK